MPFVSIGSTDAFERIVGKHRFCNQYIDNYLLVILIYGLIYFQPHDLCLFVPVIERSRFFFLASFFTLESMRFVSFLKFRTKNQGFSKGKIRKRRHFDGRTQTLMTSRVAPRHFRKKVKPDLKSASFIDYESRLPVITCG